MKFYSDVTRKVYETQKALEADEARIANEKAVEDKKNAERTSRAKEVENAYKAEVNAHKHYLELRNAFVKDYGSFHMSFKETAPLDNVTSIFDVLFGL